MTFSNIAGTINEEDQQRFARFLFRMSRGNSFTNFTPIGDLIVDPKTGKEVKKSVFVVFFQDVKGAGEGVLYNKIVKACSQFGVNNYEWPCTTRLPHHDKKCLLVGSSSIGCEDGCCRYDRPPMLPFVLFIERNGKCYLPTVAEDKSRTIGSPHENEQAPMSSIHS